MSCWCKYVAFGIFYSLNFYILKFRTSKRRGAVLLPRSRGWWRQNGKKQIQIELENNIILHQNFKILIINSLFCYSGHFSYLLKTQVSKLIIFLNVQQINVDMTFRMLWNDPRLKFSSPGECWNSQLQILHIKTFEKFTKYKYLMSKNLLSKATTIWIGFTDFKSKCNKQIKISLIY